MRRRPVSIVAMRHVRRWVTWGVLCGTAVAWRATAAAPDRIFSASVRAAGDGRLVLGRPFAYWLELKNVSSRPVSIKSNLSVTFSYAQGELGGGSGNMHWAPCHSETYLINPGQTLAQLNWVETTSPKPGAAVLEFHVSVREGNPDGTCAKTEHVVEATMPVRVSPRKS